MRHPANVGGRRRSKLLEIDAAMVEIAHHHLAGAQPGRLTDHGLAGIDFGDDQLTQSLLQLRGREAAGETTGERPFNGGKGRQPLFRIGGKRNTKQPA